MKRFKDFILESNYPETFTFVLIEECDECEGTGEVGDDESPCEHCNEGLLEWSLEFVQFKGINNMYEKYGNSDQPIYYDNGNVAYNHPSMFPIELKEIVRHIFKNKDLNKIDIINSVVRYMIENKIEYKISEEMLDNLNTDTQNIIRSYSGLNKFNI